MEWYAIRTKANCEHTVRAGLEARGLENFLAAYTERRRWSDRVREVALPLFPGYVFCRFDIQHQRPIITTPGVVNVVSFGRTPAPIDEAEIESVRSFTESLLPLSPCPFVRVGQRVKIVDGPLRGAEGILAEIKDRARLITSITLLQRSVSVEIDAGWVQPI